MVWGELNGVLGPGQTGDRPRGGEGEQSRLNVSSGPLLQSSQPAALLQGGNPACVSNGAMLWSSK